MAKDEPPRLLTVPELAAHFGKGESTIWSWKAKGADGFTKLGRRTVADPEEVQGWIDRTGATEPGPRPKGFVPPLANPEGRAKAAEVRERIDPAEKFLDLDSLDEDAEGGPPETLQEELRAIGAVSRKLKRLLDAINLKSLSDPRMAGTFLKLVSGYTTNQARAIKIREALEEERVRAGKLIPADEVLDLLARIGAEHKERTDGMADAVTEEAIDVLNEAGIGAAFDSDIMESRLRARARAILNEIADSIEEAMAP